MKMDTTGGSAQLAPWLAVGAPEAALQFCIAALDAVEAERLENGDGAVEVARPQIDSAAFWIQRGISSDGGDGASERPVRLILSVDDPDAVMSRAIDAGGNVIVPVMHENHGWRSGRIVDPFGHDW